METEPILTLLERHFGPAMLFGGIALLILALYTTLFCKDLRISIYIFLLSIVFTHLANPVLHVVAYGTRWLILALILTRIIRAKSHITLSKVSVLFALWTAVAIMSAGLAFSVSRGLVFAAVYFLCFVVFFLLMASEITTQEQMQSWFKMFGYLAWTFAVLAIVVFVTNPAGRGFQGRLAGVFANPMAQSRSLVFALTILLWSALRLKGRLLRQALYYGVILICSALLFLSGSRGALGGFAITLVIFALHYRTKMAFIIIPALIVGGLYTIPKIMARSTEQFSEHISTLESRAREELFDLGIQRFKERPISGWGLGSLSDMRSPVCPGYVSLHNSFLNFLVEFGVFGFLVVMTVFVYTYLRIWKLALFDFKTEYIRDVAWFITANLTTLFAWNYFDGALSHPSWMHFYWVIILIVLTECLVRINQGYVSSVESEFPEYIYEDYDEGRAELAMVH